MFLNLGIEIYVASQPCSNIFHRINVNTDKELPKDFYLIPQYFYLPNYNTIYFGTSSALDTNILIDLVYYETTDTNKISGEWCTSFEGEITMILSNSINGDRKDDIEIKLERAD